nr:amidohydrolase family protein [Streptomyces sp. Ag82_O1-15]
MALMEKGGMSPAEVLATTTSSAADLLGMSDLTGRLRPGLLADLVVVDGDPRPSRDSSRWSAWRWRACRPRRRRPRPFARLGGHGSWACPAGRRRSPAVTPRNACL